MRSLEKKLNRPITVMYLIDTCIDVPNKPSMGGAEKQLYLLVSSLNPAYFKSIVVQLNPNKSLPLIDVNVGNAELFHVPTIKFYSLDGIHQIGRLCRLAKQYNVDIIHTFFEKSEVMGWLTARLSSIPIWITSRRDLGFKRKTIYNEIFKLAARDCKRCVANCLAVKNQAIQKERLAEEKMEVIYNGLDLSPYQQCDDGRELRNNLNVNNHVPLVGMIADFNFEIKGHRYFLQATKTVLKKIPEVGFLLVGEGSLRNRYEEMARELGVRGMVHFLGKRSDIPTILSNLTISVLSSTSEGLSNFILESMAAGKPVVATNVGGNKEMVKDGITGYLVPPADSNAMANAIMDLLKNPEKAVAMGGMGRKEVKEKFTVEAMVRKYEELYFSLVKGRG